MAFRVSRFAVININQESWCFK